MGNTLWGEGIVQTTNEKTAVKTVVVWTTNAVIEGDEATLDASTATTRLGNYLQIADKTVVVSGTQDVVNKAGRKSELAYQIAKKGNFICSLAA